MNGKLSTDILNKITLKASPNDKLEFLYLNFYLFIPSIYFYYAFEKFKINVLILKNFKLISKTSIQNNFS